MDGEPALVIKPVISVTSGTHILYELPSYTGDLSRSSSSCTAVGVSSTGG